MKMKNLILVVLLTIGSQTLIQAQDVYICELVLFCNQRGQCVAIEICDVVESEPIEEIRDNFRGSFVFKSSTLMLRGFSKKLEGRTIIIKKKNIIKAPEKGNPEKALVGQSIVPGKYKIKNGKLKLQLDKKKRKR